MSDKNSFFGTIMIIGKSNVGKSTILNKLFGKKISITSKKNYTTRSPILAVRTEMQYQFAYIDTPGYLSMKNNSNIKCRYFNFKKITILLYVIDNTNLYKSEEIFLKKIKLNSIIILLIINKIDKIKIKEKLLPFIREMSKKNIFERIIPISAKKTNDIRILKTCIKNFLPNKKHQFSNKIFINQPINIRIQEIVREKIMRFLGDEVPYKIQIKLKNIEVDKFNQHYIQILLLVKKNSHKKILIGKNGKKIEIIKINTQKEIKKILNINSKIQFNIKKIHN